MQAAASKPQRLVVAHAGSPVESRGGSAPAKEQAAHIGNRQRETAVRPDQPASRGGAPGIVDEPLYIRSPEA